MGGSEDTKSKSSLTCDTIKMDNRGSVLVLEVQIQVQKTLYISRCMQVHPPPLF